MMAEGLTRATETQTGAGSVHLLIEPQGKDI